MTNLNCQDKFHEDEYENGKVLPLRRADMVGTICIACQENRDDQADFDRANDPDRR